MTINCLTKIPWENIGERLNNVSKNNVFAERVELLQVSEAAGDFETGTPLTFNLYHRLLAI